MRLPDEFYAQDVLDVAPALVGKILCRKLSVPASQPTAPSQAVLRMRITETEAYRGREDTACHASKGKTNRTAVMFGPGGAAYVYLCYGIHNLLNVVTGPAGEPQAALIRGVEGHPGPGKCTKAMGIDRTLNGHDMRGSGTLWLEDDGYAPAKILTRPRVGIAYASVEDQAKPWRFIAG